MVRVWVAGKTVCSPCYTWAISECFRDKELIIKRYINSPSFIFFTRQRADNLRQTGAAGILELYLQQLHRCGDYYLTHAGASTRQHLTEVCQRTAAFDNVHPHDGTLIGTGG